MNNSNCTDNEIYDVIVIGAGASGLFYSACDAHDGRKLLLEKTDHAGQKLLMSGNGMCNITHSGSIKDFIGKYGENGRQIRSCLYRHSNTKLMELMESLGVHLVVREDGKVFPESMKARDVLDALVRASERTGWEIRYRSEVIRISQSGSTAELTLHDDTVLSAKKVVIACGGSSYPSTGSDGTFLDVLSRDLGVTIIKPRPALAPIFVQDYRFSDISGVSISDVRICCGRHTTTGPMLLTHKGFSGPAVLHMSQYVAAGDTITISFIPDTSREEVIRKIKSDAPGNSTGLAKYIAYSFSLPRSFVEILLSSPMQSQDSGASSDRKLSSLSGSEIVHAADLLTSGSFSVSGTGGWNDSMVTAGGVSLECVDLRTMRLKDCSGACSPEKDEKETGSISLTLPDIRIIGEVLDVNGETGGYNLQFAYSSAVAAL